jgi:hypothetical protein
MFKNPYLLPLIGLIALGILFTVQRKQATLAESAPPVEVLEKPVLVTSFRDPIAMNSLSGWEKNGDGYLGNAITFPAKGFIEFDVAISEKGLSETKAIFSLRQLNSSTDKEPLFSVYVYKGCDSIGLVSGKISGSKYFKGGCSLFPIRSRIEWNDSSLILYVNGRYWTGLPLLRTDSVSAVRPFVLHTEDSNSVSNPIMINDLRLYKQ